MTLHTQVATNIALLSAWIEAQMAYKHLPGLSISIVHDQDVVWAKGFGFANVEEQTPATPDTLYRIASITKMFTATALLQLRDAGKLQLDDPIAKHLGWFDIRSRHADSPPITIRHLITHTSGLPRESAHPYWTDAEFPTPQQIREGLACQELILAADTRWKYSQSGFGTGGRNRGCRYPVRPMLVMSRNISWHHLVCATRLSSHQISTIRIWLQAMEGGCPTTNDCLAPSPTAAGCCRLLT